MYSNGCLPDVGGNLLDEVGSIIETMYSKGL